ncbi:MAG: MBL fold metallo-hydrolase [Pseudomonadota bacterium]
MARLLFAAALAAFSLTARAEPDVGDVSIVVLGIAQDAGYPQTDCYKPHCLRAWHNPEHRRTTSSIAVIDETTHTKYLFDATPDMREQLFRLQQLAPDDNYPLNGVFLTHAHIGHYVGLMHFGHEASSRDRLPVYAMPRMADFLATNGPWDQLVRLRNIELQELADGTAVKLGESLAVTPMQVPHRDEYSETVGYRIDGPRRSAVFIPDIDKWEDWQTDIRDVIRDVDYALLDAAFFADGELPGRDMSKIRHPFVSESMDLFRKLSAEEKARVIFIHMNHTNPLLIDGSDAQQEVERRGFRFAREGMRLPL